MDTRRKPRRSNDTGRILVLVVIAHGQAAERLRQAPSFSTEEPAEFWSALWDFTKISGDKGQRPYLADADKMPGARFFPTARLNFAENLLRHAGTGAAIVFWGEDKVKRRLSGDELSAEVGKANRAFSASGVVAGDRVAGILPNMPESIVSALGAANPEAIDIYRNMAELTR